MTEPLSYIAKDPTTIQAMLFDGTFERAEDIGDWIVPLLGEGAAIIPSPYGSSLTVRDDTFELNVPRGHYVYLDGDGFHAVEKGAFELVRKVDDGL